MDFLGGFSSSGIRKPFFPGCQNSAFGRRSFCLGDTRQLRYFRRLPGSEEQNPLFLWVECNIGIFADFRQNHLFSVGDKNPVFQNDRFDNPDFVPTSLRKSGTLTGTEGLVTRIAPL